MRNFCKMENEARRAYQREAALRSYHKNKKLLPAVQFEICGETRTKRFHSRSEALKFYHYILGQGYHPTLSGI